MLGANSLLKFHGNLRYQIPIGLGGEKLAVRKDYIIYGVGNDPDFEDMPRPTPVSTLEFRRI